MIGLFEKVVDEKLFLEIIQNDLSVIPSIINLYKKQSDENILLMKKSISNNDKLNFERAAHDLRNLGRNIASRKLIMISDNLEDKLNNYSLESLNNEIIKTEKVLRKAESELRKILKKNSS
jgi:HPt (histidine-containing phosphotransfer) domain-containing protein